MQHVAVGALVAPTTGVRELIDGRAVVLADPESVDGMWAAVGADVTHLVLLGERRHEALVRRHAALVSDRGVAVSWRVLPHGPAAIVALALEAAAQPLDAGLVPTYVDELAARTWSGAWTPTVTKLEDPAPSVAQHLRSLLPGGNGFLVTLTGEPEVVAIGASVDPRQSAFTCTAVICASAALPELAARAVLALCGAGERITVPGLTFDPLGRFGSAKAIEMLALPTDDVIHLPRVERLPRCAGCGAAVPGPFCSYCHVRPVRASVELQGALQ